MSPEVTRTLHSLTELYGGPEVLTEAQLDYAASDVLYLHRLRSELDALTLEDVNRFLHTYRPMQDASIFTLGPEGQA